MFDLYINLSNKLPVLALLALSAASVIIGDYFGKSWSVNNKTLFLIFSLVAYSLSSILYTPTLLRKGLVYTAIIWDLMSIGGFLFIGFILFKEAYSPTQIIGIFLGVAALILLSIGGR